MSDDVKYLVWHIANVPGPAFRMSVPSPEVAMLVLDALANFDNFVGDDKPWTTVGGRRAKMAELSKRLPAEARADFGRYADYLLSRSPGGVPIVSSNVQGLETWEDGDDIGDLMRARAET